MSIVQIGTQEQTKGKHISNVLTRIVTENPIQMAEPDVLCCVYVCLDHVSDTNGLVTTCHSEWPKCEHSENVSTPFTTLV